MSGFNAFTYNGSPFINSFCDIVSINLPSTQTYTVNQYNILAPTIDETPGYVLQTNNNIISIADGSNGFYINNTGIYKISLCFSFDDSNDDSGIITTDFMLNAYPLTTSSDVSGVNTILNVNATGTALTFDGLTNNGLSLSGKQISDNMLEIYNVTTTQDYTYRVKEHAYLINPNVMYCNDPAFFFARYYLSTVNDSGVIPQVLRFESTVNITSTTDNNNYFYPCICPYDYTMWNTGANKLPSPFLMVEMVSSVPL